MSSLVTSIDRLVGLTSAKKAVERILSSQTNVHAILLYGPEGAGKSTLARLLAKAWLCTSPETSGQACGLCKVCLAFDASRAVDYQCWEPWGPMSLIKLSAMRPVPGWEQDKERPELEFVMHFLRTRPLMSRNKVVHFEAAHRFNSDAANAFLKTLEEPPPRSRIILTTSEFTRVLPTVRSRCMCLACELPEPERATVAGEYFSPVESVFGGSPGGVAHIKEHAQCFQDLYDLLESTDRTPFGGAFLLAEKARTVADRYAKSAGLSARASNVKVIEAIAAWAASRHPDRPSLLAKIAESHRLLLGNAQPGAVFEVLFIELLYHKREHAAC